MAVDVDDDGHVVEEIFGDFFDIHCSMVLT